MKIKVFSYGVFYYLILLINYIEFIVPAFGYSGFYNDFNVHKLIISIFLISLYSLIMNLKGVLGFYHVTLFSIVFLPSLSLYTGGLIHPNFIFITSLACYTVVVFSNVIKIKSIKSFTLSTNVLTCLFLMISFLVIIGVALINGFASFNLDLLKVYYFRDDFSKNLPEVFNYFLPIVGKILLPISVVLSLIKKQYFFVLTGVLFSVLLYAYTAHKSPLIYPVVIILLYYLSGKNLVNLIFLFLILLQFITIIDAYMFLNDMHSFGLISSFLSRRAIFVPVMLNNAYIEFFSQNVFLFWSESKLTFGLLTSPYMQPTPFVIGSKMFGDETLAANTGFIGSGYANAGLFGVILYSLLIGFLISFFDSISKYIDPRFIISVTFIIMYTIFMSADFITSLLTHGLFFLIIILLVMPRTRFF